MSRLHVDRPCRVCRQVDGRWGWRCDLCPPPLRLVTSTADSWRTAFDDADTHVRADHQTNQTDRWIDRSSTATGLEEPAWRTAA